MSYVFGAQQGTCNLHVLEWIRSKVSSFKTVNISLSEYNIVSKIANKFDFILDYTYV